MSEDMTFCDEERCANMRCERNKKHIRLHWMPHSFASFRGEKPWCKGYTTAMPYEIKHSSGRSGKKENMDNGRFEEICKDIVLEYSNEHVHKDDGKQITKDDVYIVWICKTLQNNKALLSTKVHGDGMYYEVTYNGDKQQIYLDAYKKVENMAIDVVD